MGRRNYGLYAVALAIVVVGALWVGLPVGTLAVFGLIVMCPVMMFFMMRGMGGMGGGSGNHSQEHRDDSAGSMDPRDHNSMR